MYEEFKAEYFCFIISLRFIKIFKRHFNWDFKDQSYENEVHCYNLRGKSDQFRKMQKNKKNKIKSQQV